jgi:hypothetical protein
MATITTRSGKGSPLTHTEGDANFTNLNNDKLENINNENLGDLANVSSSAPSDGQVLTYNNANSEWQPQTASSGGGGGISRAVLQAGSKPAATTATSTWSQMAWAWEKLKDTDSIVTTSGNAFTLSTGTYWLDITLGNMRGFASTAGNMYWPVFALRNSSDSSYPWGWGAYGAYEGSVNASSYHTAGTVSWKAYFEIFSSKTFDIVYKRNSGGNSAGVVFEGNDTDWDNNTATRSPGFIEIQKLA